MPLIPAPADTDEVDRLREVPRLVAHRSPSPSSRGQDVLDLVGHAPRGVRPAQRGAGRRHGGEARAVAEQLGDQARQQRAARARRRRPGAPRRRRPSPARSCAGGRRWRTGTAPGSPACRGRRARRRSRPSAPRPDRPPPWRRPGGQCRAPGDSAQTARRDRSSSRRTWSALLRPAHVHELEAELLAAEGVDAGAVDALRALAAAEGEHHRQIGAAGRRPRGPARGVASSCAGLSGRPVTT